MNSFFLDCLLPRIRDSIKLLYRKKYFSFITVLSQEREILFLFFIV